MRLISQPDARLYASCVSAWEMAIKHQKYPDTFLCDAQKLIQCSREMGFELLPISEHHIIAYSTVIRHGENPIHKDPFDRMLIAQAKAENMQLITHDEKLPFYREKCVLYFE